eukprot:3384290-Rhodomonas_salina.2
MHSSPPAPASHPPLPHPHLPHLIRNAAEQAPAAGYEVFFSGWKGCERGQHAALVGRDGGGDAGRCIRLPVFPPCLPSSPPFFF